jgi:hypothetical protein
MLVKLKIGDWKIEALGVLFGLLLKDLRLIFATCQNMVAWLRELSLSRAVNFR